MRARSCRERFCGLANGSACRFQVTDIYNRSFAVAGAGPSVECASCHDPHRADTSTFLRIANAGSAVCLACHVK